MNVDANETLYKNNMSNLGVLYFKDKADMPIKMRVV